MAMKDMDAALQLVARNDRQADFVGKRSTEMVADAESALGVRFPPTYRKFLTELGAGDIAGEEFYGVTTNTFVSSSVPNGIWLTLEERKGGLPSPLVIVYATGDGTWFALDTSEVDSQGESPVVSWTPGSSMSNRRLVRVADDFGQFFLHTIREALSGLDRTVS